MFKEIGWEGMDQICVSLYGAQHEKAFVFFEHNIYTLSMQINYEESFLHVKP